jgi:hypothetical protein
MVVAVGLMAAIGPIDRFEGPDKLVAYLGLNRRPASSYWQPGRKRLARLTARSS